MQINKAPMRDLGDRLPKWKSGGSLIHANGKMNWTWMKVAKPGEYMPYADLSAKEKNTAYIMARRYDISITIRREENDGDYRIIRIF